MIKPFDDASFQGRKDTKERGEEKNDDFYMEILEEVAREKTLNAEKRTIYKNHVKQYMR